MKKIIGLAGVLLLMAHTASQAQISDKLVPHLGFSYEVLNLENAEPNSSGFVNSDFSRVLYAFNIGTYYTLYHQNDRMSVGVDPSLNFGFNFISSFNETRVNLLVQLPVYLMGRVGANSTKYNQQKIGVGAGIGGMYTFFRDGGSDRNLNGFVPNAVFEGTLLSRGGTLTIRGHLALFKPDVTFQAGNDNPGSTDVVFNDFGTWGVGLIYGF